MRTLFSFLLLTFLIPLILFSQDEDTLIRKWRLTSVSMGYYSTSISVARPSFFDQREMALKRNTLLDFDTTGFISYWRTNIDEQAYNLNFSITRLHPFIPGRINEYYAGISYLSEDGGYYGSQSINIYPLDTAYIGNLRITSDSVGTHKYEFINYSTMLALNAGFGAYNKVFNWLFIGEFVDFLLGVETRSDVDAHYSLNSVHTLSMYDTNAAFSNEFVNTFNKKTLLTQFENVKLRRVWFFRPGVKFTFGYGVKLSDQKPSYLVAYGVISSGLDLRYFPGAVEIPLRLNPVIVTGIGARLDFR